MDNNDLNTFEIKCSIPTKITGDIQYTTSINKSPNARKIQATVLDLIFNKDEIIKIEVMKYAGKSTSLSKTSKIKKKNIPIVEISIIGIVNLLILFITPNT